MAYQWNYDDRRRWDAAVAATDFGNLDRDEVIANSLDNSSDVPEEEDPVGVAISTMEMYIDQGVSSF